jgi:hypothetical protein
VCFDIVDGLLTDPSGSTARNLLVHHISVAVLSNARDSVTRNLFPPIATSRRSLLESVIMADKPTTTNNGESLPSAALGLQTMARDTSGGPSTPVVVSDASIVRDIDGPKHYAPIFFPIFFVFIFSGSIIIGAFCVAKRYKQNMLDALTRMSSEPSSRSFGNTESLLRRPSAGSKMFD